jgi:hypothetical protein
MDSNQLGEAISPTAWATAIVLSVAALLACWFDWRKLGDLSFFRSLLSGECRMETILVSIRLM